MKKIKIIHIAKSDKQSTMLNKRTHCISLGNGSLNYFSNICKAKEFLAHTNRFLNQRMFDLNELFIEAHTHFQRNWFYFDNSQELKSFEQNCYRNFATIHECMKMCYDRGHYQNGNHMVFKHINLIEDCLIEVIKTIKKLHLMRGNWAESNCMDVIIRRIEYIRKIIEIYPKKEFCNQNVVAVDPDIS